MICQWMHMNYHASTINWNFEKNVTFSCECFRAKFTFERRFSWNYETMLNESCLENKNRWQNIILHSTSIKEIILMRQLVIWQSKPIVPTCVLTSVIDEMFTSREWFHAVRAYEYLQNITIKISTYDTSF